MSQEWNSRGRKKKISRAARAAWLVSITALAMLAADADNRAGAPADLTHMSLESLMATEITSVSRKSQRLSDTAAAVWVITRDDIRRSGVSSLPELLRLAPGVQVARIDASRWAIGVRGFNGEFSNKLLVLMDGRTVYTEIFSGVYWDMQDTMVEDIERIEVIRGPGATMWGSNAVNGVINIITRNARDTQGSLLSLTAGSDERLRVAYRYGGRVGPVTWYRLFTRFFNETTADPSVRRDPSLRTFQVGLRVDSEISSKDKISVNVSMHNASSLFYRNIRMLTPPWSTATASDGSQFNGFLLGRWSHKINSGEISLQAYFDHSALDDVWRKESVNTGDVEFQYRQRVASRHEVNWGLGMRAVSDEVTKNATLELDPRSLGREKYSFFVQDEWAAVPETLVFTLGSKFEHNYFTGLEIQPTARLLWTPAPRESVWTSVSRAVRTPSRVDRGISMPGVTMLSSVGLPMQVSITGNPGFVSEDMTGFELGYRRQITSRLTLDSSWFLNRYTHLAGYVLGAPTLEMTGDYRPFLRSNMLLDNISSARTYGTEMAVNLTPTERWKLSGSYSWLRIIMNDTSLTHKRQDMDQLNFGAPNSPQHQGQLRTDLDLGHGWSLDAAYYMTGAIAQMGVPGYTRCDARLAWRPSSSTELSVNGENLLKARHFEFYPEGTQQMFSIRRSAYAKLTFWF